MELNTEVILSVNDPEEIYGLNELLFKQEVYEFIGCCFEVHKILGRGFVENVYKDALAYELNQKGIPFEREKKCRINYKNIILDHYYFCDFIIHDKIIIEVKAQDNIIGSHYKQLINYLAVTNNKLGLLVNFGEDSLKFKRVVL